MLSASVNEHRLTEFEYYIDRDSSWLMAAASCRVAAFFMLDEGYYCCGLVLLFNVLLFNVPASKGRLLRLRCVLSDIGERSTVIGMTCGLDTGIMVMGNGYLEVYTN